MPNPFAVGLYLPYGTRRVFTVNVVCQQRGDGKIVRVFRSRRVQRSWEVQFNTLSRSDRTTLDNLVHSMRGRMTSFPAYDAFDGSTYTARLDNDSVQFQEPAPTRWASSIKLLAVDTFDMLKSATMAFPALSTGAVVELPYTMGRDYRTIVGILPDFTETRFEDLGIASGIQRWGVGGDRLSDTEAGVLINFWQACYGPYKQFTFTEPETSVAFAGHFVEKSLVHVPVEHNANQIRLTVEELVQ